jgi:hypothetical protein
MTNAQQSVEHADRGGDEDLQSITRTTHADALHAVGRREAAERRFADAEQRQQKMHPKHPMLYPVWDYRYCELLLSKGEPAAARDRATRTLKWAKAQKFLLDIALDKLTVARAGFASALIAVAARRG